MTTLIERTMYGDLLLALTSSLLDAGVRAVLLLALVLAGVAGLRRRAGTR